MWLFKKANIIDPKSKFHLSTKDILVENGIITKIEDHIPNKNCKEIVFENMYVSTGWLDIGVYLGEPGNEHRETVLTLNEACKKGGFTSVATSGNEMYPITSKTDISFLSNTFDGKAVDIIPIGAISSELKGKELSEMYDLKSNGVIAFSDNNHTIQDTGLLMRALEYCKIFDGIIIQQPTDQQIAKGGMMHEGFMSTNLGLKGIPSLAEIIIIERDLELVKYLDTKIHFSSISSKEGVELIRKAKKDGLQVSCSVNFHHLIFTDEDLNSFDSNLKIIPPIRSKNDQLALWEGLKDGTIDYVESGHLPCDTEIKEVEFPYAAFGAIGLETLFPALNTFSNNKLSITEVINKINYNKRALFGLENSIAEGNVADFTFFNTDEEWNFELQNIGSKCKNTPFIGMKFKGKVLGTFKSNTFFEN